MQRIWRNLNLKSIFKLAAYHVAARLNLILILHNCYCLDTPEIRLEKRLIADRSKIELEMICTVHAEPKPVVR